jgi:hypothetical protein
MMVYVNKQRMIDNQTYVKLILQLAGEENLVDVETDFFKVFFLTNLDSVEAIDSPVL